MLSCILVEPESPGNIGSVARVMMNFGVTGHLILVNPPTLTDEAYMMACNAKTVLEAAIVTNDIKDAFRMVDFTVATSREAGDEYNVNRISLQPEDLARAMKIDVSVGIVFGRESSGLTNEEISMSDMLVTIPTDPAYPTMNLSHAAAIVFYELYKLSEDKRPVRLEGASGSEKGMLYEDYDAIVDILEKREYRRKTAKTVFRRVVSRSFISSREAYTLKGVLKKVLKGLGGPKG